MMAVRRHAEEVPSRRATLARAMAAVFEEKLRSPREAFDAWGEALVDEPQALDALVELDRLADLAQAHARFAEIIAAAADRLPEGAAKSALLARRASLLQGVLGDQVAAIEAHRAILQGQPSNVSSLDALADLYEQRDAWGELRDILLERLRVGPSCLLYTSRCV